MLSYVLMHALTVDDYATYVLSYASAMFAAGFFNATFVTRAAVQLGSCDRQQRPRIAHECALGSVLAGAALLLAGLALAALGLGRWPVWAFAAGMLTRDGVVRTANAAEQTASALTAAVTYSGLSIAVAVLPFATALEWQVDRLLMALTGALVSSACVYWILERPQKGISVAAVRALLAWFRTVATIRDPLALGFFVTWLQAQLVLFLAATLFEPAAVAQLGAARLFSAPLVFLSQALAAVAVARLAAPGPRARRLARRFIWISGVAALLYAVTAGTVGPALAEALLPSSLPLPVSTLVAAVALGAVQFFKDSVRFTAVARGQERAVLMSGVFGLMVSLTLVVAGFFVSYLSLASMLVAFAVGEVATSVALLKPLRLR